jgi:hypothetical protein
MWKVYNGNILDVNDNCVVVGEFEDIIDAEKYLRDNCKGKLWSVEDN